MLTSNTFIYAQDFPLELGKFLPGLQLRYTTFGKLNETGSNVIWVCHAFSGSSNFTEWWPGLFGEGLLFDPEKYFIICVNMPGSCYGSTGPLSIDPRSGIPYYHQFPELTNRDIINSFILVRQHLGIKRIHTVIGSSLGGQQTLEWGIMEPEVIEHIVCIGANAYHSPWGIAFNETQRMAICQDVTWSKDLAEAGLNGMKVARAIALLSYRNYETYKATQSEDDIDKTQNFKAYSYQAYQGEKLARRFNAFSYWILSKAMDTHNVGRNRGSVEKALKMISAKSLIIAIESDILFPKEEQKFLVKHVQGAKLGVIDSLYGHDGFLLEAGQLTDLVSGFYSRADKLS
ncbi:MAG TPA: homoserine O-acetyltransferase [Cyclobacteriaceae bacterium]|nr:homoserine O-acetyltransferase [Cyclobacteriaceae bacterium]